MRYEFETDDHYPYQNIQHEGLPKEILRALKMKEMN